ncbi:ABC transporter ATP-binding protein [Saliterribacillus persicus]|uniref:Iron complex transport system ATP-binding protein n=1 Tax=Saliterribacillus persicus TaxID=930114 RepID=A0A368XG79_9BACI|nr:ATP-binding cassette domain-containing protein [Saliterribacillus persicus]RCW67000.1 iron complex transport system ATP-binding protein [Saliterribacillus persicus]
MIEVKDLTKKYGDKAVLNDVSVSIPKGKITSFIGPNGAGKSTLLSIVSRLIQKDSGEVFLDKKDVTKSKSKELAKKIAILKQANHINVKLTVEQLVSFGRFPYSQGKLTKEDLRYIKEAIDYMELSTMKDKFIDELSGGQKQRAYIAMVMAQDTEYILLDEPLNNLDMKHSVQIMKVLKKLVDDLGKTVIIVIHDVNFASVYSDYIVALKDGKIIHHGEKDWMINKDILRDVYDMDINIQDIDQCKICLYFH